AVATGGGALRPRSARRIPRAWGAGSPRPSEQPGARIFWGLGGYLFFGSGEVARGPATSRGFWLPSTGGSRKPQAELGSHDRRRPTSRDQVCAGGALALVP